MAAMAYGTETVPAVDVIVGPGSVYVALAKREVAGHVGSRRPSPARRRWWWWLTPRSLRSSPLSMS
ncbi:MAG: hypothetical protein Ct9H300mP31_20510 [Acidimicrobiaceae bacterium]|nr:MAG: hypothetical protein Ct9H300mP31_20510 [Acidimicrobiaceae bacterium]